MKKAEVTEKVAATAADAEEDLRDDWSNQHEAGGQTMEADFEEAQKAKAVEASGFYEPGNKVKEQMATLAGMIEKAGPKVEGGFAGLVEGLKTGKLSKEQKVAAKEVIAQIQKGFKWGKKNEAVLKELYKNFDYETQSEKKVEQNGMGDILESWAEKRAEEINKKAAYQKLGELIIRVNPLKAGNKELGKLFLNNAVTEENFDNALKAIKIIRNEFKKDKATLLQLDNAENFLNQQFKSENRISDKVIEMPNKGKKSGSEVRGDIAA